MNTLFVIHTPKDPQTAVFKVISEQADGLRARGHSVEILAPQDFGLARWAGPRFNPLLFPALILLRLIRTDQRYDLIKFHSYSGWLFAVLRPILRPWRKTKIVTEFHGLEPVYIAALQKEAQRSHKRLRWRYRLVNSWLMDGMLRSASRCSDRVFCLNRNERRVLTNKRWASDEKVVLFKNGVPAGFFDVARSCQRRDTTLLFVGQWNPMKGTAYLAQAFAQLARRRHEISLICAGTLCDEKTVLEDFPADVRGRVTVYPRVDRDKLIELHSIADIFVFPTLSEGCSVALLEAMASGLPIVTTPVGSAPDILEDQGSAVLVPFADPPSLAAAIQTLLDDRKMCTRLGINARSAAQEYRSAIALAHNISQLEDLLLDEGRLQLAHEVSVAGVKN